MNKSFHVFIKRLFLFIPALAVFGSCSTDFDPNADYKEIPVIYTILDPTETTHFVKVNKAFLNTGTNALTIAANNPDSTTYQTPIQVELIKVRNDRDSLEVESFQLEKVLITNKEPGDFYYPEQELYKVENVQLDPRFLYRIRITNPNSGVVAHGTAALIDPFCARIIGQVPFRCEDTTNTIEYTPELAATIRYNTAEKAGIYKATAYFTYTERLNGNSEVKTIRWDLTSNELRSHAPQSYVDVRIDKDAVLEQMVTILKPQNDPAGLSRTPGSLRFVITAGSGELATYYTVNNSFSVFSQTLPEYDNVSNGTGLIASRRKLVIRAILPTLAIEYIKRAYPELKFQ